MTRNKIGFAWKGALAAALVATACGKVASDHGGESHFQCMGDDDCHGSGEVCVRAAPADETGECRPVTEVTGTADAGTFDSGAGGSSNQGGGSGASAGGTPGAGAGGTGASNFGGAAGGPVALGQCGQACCSRDEACYETPLGSFRSGRECMALRENTGQSRIQLRLTSTKTFLPNGLAIPIIQQTRNTYTHLPLDGQNQVPNCYGTMSSGGGRFIQLLDIDLGNGNATGGFSRLLRSETIVGELASGLCAATGAFQGNPTYRLDGSQMSDASEYPANLPLPGALADSPWSVEAVNYVRSDVDITLKYDRQELLDRAPKGTYFYDEATGRYHSYSPLIYTVQYGTGLDAIPLVIPVREVEAWLIFNDAARPNCIGAISTTSECSAGVQWAGVDCRADGTCDVDLPNHGEAQHDGYMLITELEQVYEPALATTLCVTMVGRTEAEASGWLSDDGKSCKGAKWDPQAPNNEGLPMGDWCAATNSAATATCHDAFKLLERTTFAATKVKVDPVTNYAAACPIQ